MKKLDAIRGDIAFYDTGAQQVQQLQSQEVVMSIAWSGRALDAVRAGATYEPVWKDNLMLVDSLAIVKGSKNVDQGVSLINEMTSAARPEGVRREVHLRGRQLRRQAGARRDRAEVLPDRERPG
ncbi:extracellular solute-binding protein [Nonomuraea ferruginea]